MNCEPEIGGPELGQFEKVHHPDAGIVANFKCGARRPHLSPPHRQVYVYKRERKLKTFSAVRLGGLEKKNEYWNRAVRISREEKIRYC